MNRTLSLCASLLSFSLLLLASMAQAQTVTLKPATLSFAAEPIGTTSAAQTTTLKNTSTTTALTITSIAVSGEFAETTTCTGTLAAGASCTITVTSTPATIGVIDGAITVVDNAAPGTQIVSLTGKGAAPATFAPTSLALASTAIGKTSAAKNVTLTNSAVALTMGAVTASGDFAVSANTCTGTIAAGKTCVISVTFSPTVSGAITGALTIADSGVGSPQIVPLSGTGTGTVTNTVSFSPAILTFANQVTGTTSAAQTVTLTNTGTSSLSISTVSASGDYAETDTCAGKSILAAGTCAIKVTFKPTNLGAIKGAITVVDGAATSPQVVALTGTSVSPLSFSPASLTFTGTVGVTGTAQTSTLTNNSSAAITISKVAVTGDYTQTNTCGTSIAAGKSCTFSVAFSPLVTGTLDGAVTVTASGITAPQVLSLSGTASATAGTVARYAYEIVGGVPFGLLLGYSASPTTGNLRPLGAIEIPVNYGVTVNPLNKFLYVPDGPEIYGYSIGTNGSLLPLAGSPFAVDGGSTLVFTPNGEFAYNNIGTEIAMNSTTGAATLIGTATTGKFSSYVAINPAGTFVYIPNAGDATVSGYSVDQTTGVLTAISGSPFAAGETEPVSDVVSPNGKFLFVPTLPDNTSDGSTAVFSIGTTGALTLVAGSPFATHGGGNAAVVDPTGQFLYLAGSDLGGYVINATTGALTAVTGSPYQLPSEANSVTVDPSGKFLYVSVAINGVSETGLMTYSINPSTGALTLTDAKNFGESGEALAIASGSAVVVFTPKFAYVTNQGSKNISEWTINDATGALTAVSGSPISDTNGPQVVAASTSGAFVYTGNSNNTVSEYTVNTSTGALTKVSGSPITGFGSVTALVVDPTSSYLVVLDSIKQLVDSYSINAKTGALTLLSSVATPGTSSQALALDPTGTVVLVGSGDAIATYAMNNGGLGSYDAVIATTTTGSAVTMDQSGQYVLFTEPSSNTVAAFSSNTLVQVSSASTGNGPGAVLAEPSGKYVYVANSTDGTISAYSLNNATGALTQIGSAVAAAAGTDSLSISNDGKYLYATDNSAGLVSIFTINANGTLTSAGTATTGTSPTSIATTGTNQ